MKSLLQAGALSRSCGGVAGPFRQQWFKPSGSRARVFAAPRDRAAAVRGPQRSSVSDRGKWADSRVVVSSAAVDVCRMLQISERQALQFLCWSLVPERHRHLHLQADSPPAQCRTPFHGQRTPPISIAAYLERIAKYAKCSPVCFVMAETYLERLAEVCLRDGCVFPTALLFPCFDPRPMQLAMLPLAVAPAQQRTAGGLDRLSEATHPSDPRTCLA